MQIKTITTSDAPAPIGPYNQAVAANGFLYVSGQIPLDPATGELVNGTIEEETHMVMKNLAAVLAAADANFNQVLKTTIFLIDMSLFAEVNAVYGTYFNGHFPARETVAVSGLPKGVRVEISMTAAL